MPAPNPANKPRGLPSINQSREDRAARKYRFTQGVGLVGAAVLVGSLVFYKCVSTRDIERARDRILAEQQQEIQAVGHEWFALRDKLEKITMEAARDYEGDFVDPGLAHFNFRSLPGLYLRLRVVEARTIDGIRTAALESRRDAFSGCLMRPKEQIGEDAGAFPEQPWNAKQLYEGAKSLGDDFAAKITEADDLSRLRVLESQQEKALKQELPLVARIVRGSDFFLLVLDEDVPEAAEHADGGGIDEASLQLVPHPARVFLVNLKNEKTMLRLRRVGQDSGRWASADPEKPLPPPDDTQTVNTLQRQMNNCNLALQITTALPVAEPARPPSPTPPAP